MRAARITTGLIFSGTFPASATTFAGRRQRLAVARARQAPSPVFLAAPGRPTGCRARPLSGIQNPSVAGSRRAFLRSPRPKPRGWSAKRRVRFFRSAPRCRERGRLSALHGGSRGRRLACRSAPGRASWDVALAAASRRRPVPVQRAPRRPVIVPAGRGPGAARARGYEPRPRAPHPTPPSERLMRTPLDGWDKRGYSPR
jgi:hypothetical protein